MEVNRLVHIHFVSFAPTQLSNPEPISGLHFLHLKKEMVELDGFQDLYRFLRFHNSKILLTGLPYSVYDCFPKMRSLKAQVLSYSPFPSIPTTPSKLHGIIPSIQRISVIYLNMSLIFRSQFKCHFSRDAFCYHPTHLIPMDFYFFVAYVQFCPFSLFSISLLLSSLSVYLADCHSSHSLSGSFPI